jgi:L-ascorbate metabolism protein UlaG (beta-lactamase superfamily)
MPLSRRRIFTGIAAVSATAAAGAAARAGAVRYYEGPLSDHFDGGRFFDPYGAPPKRLRELLRWRTQRSGAEWPDWAPSPFSDVPPAQIDGAAWRVTYVGHASILIQTAGINILADPVWSDRVSPFSFVGPKRVNDPGIPFDKLPPIDVVLVSHNHYDHLDAPTLSRLAAAHRPRVITPLGNGTVMRSHDPEIAAEEYDWGERVALAGPLAVTLVPARHWSARGLRDRNKALWAAFVIETPGGRIFYVGDSGYGDGHHFRSVRERHGPIRLAILPIGAYEPRWFMRDQHMNPAEAVLAFRDCGAELALAHHFGTFRLTDEAIDAPLADLDKALAAAAIPPERFRALRPGQVLALSCPETSAALAEQQRA